MLYIKDYQALEQFIPKRHAPAGFPTLLRSLKGRQISVYVESRIQPFTGYLIETTDCRIRLTACPICDAKCGQKCVRCGRCVEYQIPITRISAILFPTY